MRLHSNSKKQPERGSALMAFLVIMLILSSFIAATEAYVAQTSSMTKRRNNMISALQYAQGGAVIAVNDLSTAVTTNGSATLFTKLTGIAYAPYTLNGALGGGNYKVYTRTIAASAPFSGQTVNAQIWLTNAPMPSTATIVATATVGEVTQTAIVNAKISFGLGAAILSVNNGTSETSASKAVAQDGNVTMNGSGKGPLVVYGGTNGMAAMANGRINVSSTNTSLVNVAANAFSMTNYSAGTPIPDYTSQGSSNTLFYINRFIAVADRTSGGFAPSGNNHFTNLITFITAANLYNPTVHSGGKTAMEGVIVVDVYGGDAKGKGADPDMNDMSKTGILPNGINVRGSLVFNFTGSGWDPTTSKIVIDNPININPANISGLVATNPATYTTGYPPVYANTNMAPFNINITGVTDPATGLKDFQNFVIYDDLPAMVYTIGVVDLHNSLNISGAMYTPSYMEIENKHDGDTQYIMGELIMGNGIYLENTSAATTVVAYDVNAVNNLATSGTAGKKVYVTFWQR
jgi:hypothetical protein